MMPVDNGEVWHQADNGTKLPIVSERGDSGPVLAPYGVDETGERVYRHVLRVGQTSLADLASRLRLSATEARNASEHLWNLGLVSVRDGVVFSISPRLAINRLADREVTDLLRRERHVGRLRSAVPGYLFEEHADIETLVHPVTVDSNDLSEGAASFESLVRETTGELLFVHPVQWLDGPHWPKMQAVARGNPRRDRPVRTIFPEAALVNPEVMELIRDGAALGEVGRLLPAPPAWLAVLGADTALLPQVAGGRPGTRVVVRAAPVVAVFRALFEELWSRAAPLHVDDQTGAVRTPMRDAWTSTDAAAWMGQKEVLQLLATGAKDETIARRLGVSLRTVRRRVAELMDELEAPTRFAAGVEAARRGWL